MEKELSFCVLRSKEVVNLVDGRRLGRIIDLVFDAKCGKITGIVTPGSRRAFFRICDDIFIPWCEIERIGDDVILVCLGRGKKDDKDKKGHGDDCCCDDCLRLAGEFFKFRRKRNNHYCNDRNKCDDRHDKCDDRHDHCNDRHDRCNHSDPRNPNRGKAGSLSYADDTEEYEQRYKDYYNKYDDRGSR